MSEPPDDKPRLKLNAARLIAGTLAAVTAAALSSRLGVAGTLAGTGLVSLISGAAATVYEHSVERGRVAMRKALDDFTPARPLAEEPAEQTRSPRTRSGSGRRWALAGVGAVATFALAIGVVTAIEAADGKSLSGSGHNTTIGAAFSGSHHSTTNQNRQPATPPSSHSTHSTDTPSTPPSSNSTAPSSPSTSPNTSSSPSAPKSSTSQAPTTSTPPTTTAPRTSETPKPTTTPSSP